MTHVQAALVNWELDWEHPSGRDRAELIADLPLFSRMSARRRRELARTARVAEYRKGDVVLVSGEHADDLYVVISGRAKTYSKSGTGMVADGDAFGELGLIDGAPRSASVIADGDLHVMRIPGSTFREAVERDPQLALEVVRELTARLRRAERSQSG